MVRTYTGYLAVLEILPAMALLLCGLVFPRISLGVLYRSKQYNGAALEVPADLVVAEVYDTLKMQGYMVFGVEYPLSAEISTLRWSLGSNL